LQVIYSNKLIKEKKYGIIELDQGIKEKEELIQIENLAYWVPNLHKSPHA
jgi:hypothetical protein